MKKPSAPSPDPAQAISAQAISAQAIDERAGEDEIRRRFLALLAVAAVSFTGPLGTSAVNVGLPIIAAEFSLEMASVQWVSSTYMLVLVTMLLSLGRMGDLWGYKKTYMLGAGFVFCGALLSGLAPTFQVLLAFRIVQALGAGMIMSSGPAILTSLFPASERGKALGLNSLVVGLGLTTGPALGGIVADRFGWSAMFLINLPFVVVGLILSYFWLKLEDKPRRQRSEMFDVCGSALWAVTLIALALVITQGSVWGWTSWLTLSLALLGLLVGAVFVRYERKALSPIFPLSLFGNRVFTSAVVSSLCSFVTQFIIVLLVPFFLINVANYNAQDTGLTMLALTVPVLFLAPLAGTGSDRFGTRGLTTLGLAFCTVSAWLMTGLEPGATASDVAWRLIVFGIGIGLFQSPNNNSLMGSLPAARLGTGGALMGMVRNLGMLLGVTVGSGVFTSLYTRGLARSLRAAVPLGAGAVGAVSTSSDALPLESTTGLFVVEPYVAALQTTLWLAVVVAACGAVAAWLRGNDDA